MERVPYLDESGLYTLEDSILRLAQKGTTVLLTGVGEYSLNMLQRIGLVPNLVSEDEIFRDFDECIAWLRKKRPLS